MNGNLASVTKTKTGAILVDIARFNDLRRIHLLISEL